MSTGLRIGGRQIGAATVLVALAVVLAFVALLAPEAVDEGPGSNSSHSTGPDGARIAYELAGRMGWRVGRRDSPLDTTDGRTTHVVLSPQQALGAMEVHRLLDNVRRGGGLIFDVSSGGEIADSIGLVEGGVEPNIDLAADSACDRHRSSGIAAQASGMLSMSMRKLKWRHPPPAGTNNITVDGKTVSTTVGVAFPLGSGRVVALNSGEVFHNYVMRTCDWGLDVGVARVFDSVRPAGVAKPSMLFDEFHHGYGARGGSATAVARYLAHTASGHFLEQALLAALILLMAYAPRAILPRDPERVARRSPLEHADALAHAYSDVEATRTATLRLVGGVRRRVGRTVAVAAAADDVTFLDAVVVRTPALAPSVAVVRRGLSDPLTPRQFAAVADAVLDIERHLLTTSPTAS